MRLSVTQKRLFGAFVVCVALFVCIRENVFLPEPKVVDKPDRGVVGEAFPVKLPVIPKIEEPKEAVSVVPPKVEEEKLSVPSVPVSPPPPVVKAPESVPPPVVKKQEPAPIIKKPAPLPEVKKLKPKPEPPVVEIPKPEPSPPPVIVEAPEPPPPQAERHIFRQTATPPTYFVNREVESDNIRMFPRWTGMLSRYSAEGHALDSVCGAPQHTPCKLKEWKEFLLELRDAPLLEKLTEVNRFLNKYPYIDDIVNWGFDNYWETPYEFQRKSGNCKDYAIAKFMSLRAIGVPNDIMRITVLKDLNLGGVIHAILVVSLNEKSYILDNQIKQVVSTDSVYHYMPIYSINEEHWWQHFMLN